MTEKELVQQELDSRFASEYDSIGEIHSGIAVVERDEKFGVINKNGKIIIPMIYDYISDFRNQLAAAFIEDKGCFINIKGVQISPLIYDDIAIGFIGQLNCIKFINGLVKVCVDGKYGFVNKSGQPAIPPVFDSAEDFTNSGMAIVSRDKKRGIINKEGEVIIDFKYDRIIEINKKGYITVEINKLIDVIDYSGKILSNKELEIMG